MQQRGALQDPASSKTAAVPQGAVVWLAPSKATAPRWQCWPLTPAYSSWDPGKFVLASTLFPNWIIILALTATTLTAGSFSAPIGVRGSRFGANLHTKLYCRLLDSETHQQHCSNAIQRAGMLGCVNHHLAVNRSQSLDASLC